MRLPFDFLKSGVVIKGASNVHVVFHKNTFWTWYKLREILTTEECAILTGTEITTIVCHKY